MINLNNKLYGKRIFITGAGYLTFNILKEWSNVPDISFVIYSRDEGKHELINRSYPKAKCVMGDIRDYERMKRAAHGCNYGIFTASTKCIDRVELNMEEALYTIGLGAINSKKVAVDNHFEGSVFLSTDKAVLPQTSYGNLKAFASSVFLNNNEVGGPPFSVVRYGNISASNKSLLDIVFNYIKEDKEITLFHPEMTRFYLDVERGIKCIYDALGLSNVTVIPKINSFLVKDVFDIYKKEFGLRYNIGKPRLNEKLHEDIITSDETERLIYSIETDNYIIFQTPTQKINKIFYSNVASDKFVVTKDYLYKYLQGKRFFQKP
jgi:UDP-N-acetylglucosamine 4,6-dehydratase/5-epimerase